MILLDDQRLLQVLADIAPAEIRNAVGRGEVFTTGSWYFRLGRAVTVGSGTGALSGRFSSLDLRTRERVLRSLHELPEQIGLLSLRLVVPVMQAFAVSRFRPVRTAHPARQTVAGSVARPLNFLNAEALGAALLLDATIAVSVDAPLLRAGATDLAVEYRVVS